VLAPANLKLPAISKGNAAMVNRRPISVLIKIMTVIMLPKTASIDILMGRIINIIPKTMPKRTHAVFSKENRDISKFALMIVLMRNQLLKTSNKNCGRFSKLKEDSGVPISFIVPIFLIFSKILGLMCMDGYCRPS
jgi:hypothetical protein